MCFSGFGSRCPPIWKSLPPDRHMAGSFSSFHGQLEWHLLREHLPSFKFS